MTSATLFPLETQVPAASGRESPAAAQATQSTTPASPADCPPRRTVASIRARTALTRQEGASARWFDWSANPYRGCEAGLEAGCGCCYARGTLSMSHGGIFAQRKDPFGCGPGARGAWLGHADPREFEHRIYVKEGFAAALRKDLRTRVQPGDRIAFGTATDPYQPVERGHGVMREALGELARAEGLRVSVTTKSSLVLRDVDLLRAVARRNAVRVNVTVTTPDRRLAHLLEPKAPPPGVRLATLGRLRRAGIPAGVFLMPVLPGVTDAEADLRALFRAARDAGAQSVAHQVVFLEGAARAHFLPLLRRSYPRVAARYEVWTRTGRNLPANVPATVRADVAGRVRSLLREFGIADGASAEPPVPPQPPPASVPQVQRVFAFVGPAPPDARRGERIVPGVPSLEEVTA